MRSTKLDALMTTYSSQGGARSRLQDLLGPSMTSATTSSRNISQTSADRDAQIYGALSTDLRHKFQGDLSSDISATAGKLRGRDRFIQPSSRAAETVPDVKLEEKELGSQDITPAEKRQPPTQAFCSCCEQHMSRCEVLEQENVRIRAALIYEQNKVRELNKELEIQSLGNQQLTSRCSQLLTELDHLKEKFIQSSEIIINYQKIIRDYDRQTSQMRLENKAAVETLEQRNAGLSGQLKELGEANEVAGELHRRQDELLNARIEELIDCILEMQDGHDSKVEMQDKMQEDTARLDEELKQTQRQLELENAKSQQLSKTLQLMPAMLQSQGGTANDARRKIDGMSKDAKKKFMKSDRDKNGALDKEETRRLIKKMGYPVVEDFDDVFAQFDVDESRTITLDEFAGMYHLLEERKRAMKSR